MLETTFFKLLKKTKTYCRNVMKKKSEGICHTFFFLYHSGVEVIPTGDWKQKEQEVGVSGNGSSTVDGIHLYRL